MMRRLMAGRSSEIGLRTALLVAVAGCVASSAGGWVLRDEVVLDGRFFDSEVEERLVVERMTHSLELRHGEEVVWAEGFPSYLSEILGTCRDLESGRDRVFFVTASGGSDGAMTLHVLAGVEGVGFERVFDDLTASPELGRYFHLPEPQADLYRLEPVAGMICDAGDYMSRRRRGRQVFRALAPGPEPTPLLLDENDRVVPQTLASRELDAPTVRTLFRIHDGLGPGFARETLAETERWRFERVAFYHFYDSWGVLLLEDKSTGRWRSIRALPRGDSKSYLIETAIEALGGTSAELDFCTVCPNWPAGPDGVLDLESLRLLPAVKAQTPTQ